MKKKVLFFMLMAASGIAMAQPALTTPLSLISCSGGIGSATINANPATVEWTLGETFIGSGTSGSQSITIGEQQGLRNNTTTAIKETPFSNVKVYPNPTASYIKAVNLPDGEKTILLTDMAGRTLQSLKTTDNNVILYTSQLATGVYNLVLAGQANSQSTFKISIINK